MKKLLLSMLILPLLCSCNGKTQNAETDKDSAAVATDSVSNAVADTAKVEENAETPKNNGEMVISENGVENLRIGMKRGQIHKSVEGLYDSFEVYEDEVNDAVYINFKSKKGDITAEIGGDNEIIELVFRIPNAVSSDGKLRVGMKLSDAIASGTYKFVRYPYSGIYVESEGSHFSFGVSDLDLTNSTQSYFNDREGEDVILKARPDMAKTSAKVESIVVR